ncbi:PREDICTED: TMV resistance protein N-like isoform X2 [Populus euphratica]|uniref:ADP-ribosyl cyclase/cyclic ADP-ribose hydrolase n=1 Tax=Populus euphratica TaxID=75702 RepID=A0AAJ6UKJ8_POPEU|nr:PREDICTED: TMV resistance protein N-like isoform X2 [Populus euphratica]
MASSSSAVTPPWKYDAFLSFRGADVRHNFLRHLYDALDQNEIETFIDYKLGAGEEISRILLEKIEQSNVSIVIFSKNYADSPWCLEELEKILECRQTLQQIVIPVFYHVDPTHVRELSNSYGNALAEHQRKISSDKVDNWKRVLIEIANLKGWHFNDTKTKRLLI